MRSESDADRLTAEQAAAVFAALAQETRLEALPAAAALPAVRSYGW